MEVEGIVVRVGAGVDQVEPDLGLDLLVGEDADGRPQDDDGRKLPPALLALRSEVGVEVEVERLERLDVRRRDPDLGGRGRAGDSRERCCEYRRRSGDSGHP